MFARSTIAVALVVALLPAAAYADDDKKPTPTPSTSLAPEEDPIPDVSADALTKIIKTAVGYEHNVNQAEDFQKEAAAKRVLSDAATEKADRFTGYLVDYVMNAGVNSASGRIAAVTEAKSTEVLFNTVMAEQQINQAQVDRLTEIRLAHEQAVKLTNDAMASEKKADDATKRSETLLKRMNSQAKELGFGTSTAPEGLASTRTEQTKWDRDTLTRWKRYGRALAGSTLKIPSAKQLVRITKPGGTLKPVVVDGNTILGVAEALVDTQTIRVYPKETQKLVDTVLARVGSGYSTEPVDGRYSCATLVDGIKGGYDLEGSPSDLYEGTVRVPAKTKQVGDLIFVANKTSGIHHVGLYVGNGQMVDATATRFTVGTSLVPKKPFAVTRPALGDGHNTAPRGTLKEPNTICGADLPPKVKGWRFPMKHNTYAFSAGFGQAGESWSSGFHTGQDFAAPIGTPIFASKSGTATLSEVGWAGTLITVTHPDGTSELYAHSSKQLVEDRDTVTAGDEIALVGARGNVTGPHLHFEIHEGVKPVDPLPLLLKYLPTSGGKAAWGGYGNGQIPSPVLCEVGGERRLRCDAAADYQAMATAYESRFHEAMPASAAYKGLVDQIEIDAEGKLLDLPGTSLFGWGTRIALGDLDEKEERWMDDHSDTYGWKSSGTHDWTYAAH